MLPITCCLGPNAVAFEGFMKILLSYVTAIENQMYIKFFQENKARELNRHICRYRSFLLGYTVHSNVIRYQKPIDRQHATSYSEWTMKLKA